MQLQDYDLCNILIFATISTISGLNLKEFEKKTIMLFIPFAKSVMLSLKVLKPIKVITNQLVIF